MKRLELIVVFILIFGFTEGVRSQRYFYPSSSIGNLAPANYSASVADAFSCVSNPSLVPQLSKFEADAYFEKRYLMADLMLINISAASGAGNHGFAICFQHFGGMLYNEKLITVGYGRAIGNIHLGVSFSLQGISTKGYQTENFLGEGIHSTWKLTDNVMAAFSILNPHSLFVKTDVEKGTLPAGFCTGIGYDFSKQLYGGIEVRKEQGRQVLAVASIRYFIDEEYFIRSSWTTTGNQPYLTIGWAKKIFRIETGFRYHQSLGFSPVIIFYCLPVKKNDR